MPAVFTSITIAYLAKARVLATSVKRHAPEATFYLCLSEPIPPFLEQGMRDGTEPFDQIITDSDLGIDRHLGWMFEHEVVEACTAVKAAALVHLQELGESTVLYLDPDVLVLSDLAPLIAELGERSIALTPHCPDAETELAAIEFNEISSLAHGVYNLGFFGVATDDEGQRFARWWWHRLYHYCQDDIPRGLFTDQRWIDLVPAQFERVAILRDPQYNAASWNVTQRVITGSVIDGFRVNGAPLCFYHFSGANSGVPEEMHARLGVSSPSVLDLVAHYRSLCEAAGEAELSRSRWHYATYRDGTTITRAQRVLHRDDPALQVRFPDPFEVGPGSYLAWMKDREGGLAGVELAFSESPEALREAARRLRNLEATRAYRLYRSGSVLARPLRWLAGARRPR